MPGKKLDHAHARQNETSRKVRPMPEVSHGRCLNFERCKSIDDLADGLCIKCWDKTSYKDDLVIKDSTISESVAKCKQRKKKGNMRWILGI